MSRLSKARIESEDRRQAAIRKLAKKVEEKRKEGIAPREDTSRNVGRGDPADAKTRIAAVGREVVTDGARQTVIGAPEKRVSAQGPVRLPHAPAAPERGRAVVQATGQPRQTTSSVTVQATGPRPAGVRPQQPSQAQGTLLQPPRPSGQGQYEVRAVGNPHPRVAASPPEQSQEQPGDEKTKEGEDEAEAEDASEEPQGAGAA
jgi:hypothetical protein